VREIGRECERQQWTWGFGVSVGGMHYIIFKPVAHSEIKLKQNTETARNSFRLVSASLAYFQHTNEAETHFKMFQSFSAFCFSFILECADGHIK